MKFSHEIFFRGKKRHHFWGAGGQETCTNKPCSLTLIFLVTSSQFTTSRCKGFLFQSLLWVFIFWWRLPRTHKCSIKYICSCVSLSTSLLFRPSHEPSEGQGERFPPFQPKNTVFPAVSCEHIQWEWGWLHAAVLWLVAWTWVQSRLFEGMWPWTSHFTSAVFFSSIKGPNNIYLTGRCVN